MSFSLNKDLQKELGQNKHLPNIKFADVSASGVDGYLNPQSFRLSCCSNTILLFLLLLHFLFVEKQLARDAEVILCTKHFGNFTSDKKYTVSETNGCH